MMARGMRDTGVAAGKIFHAEAQRGRGAEREMRDSGVDWIGKIPVGWEVKRLKNLALDEGSFFLDGDWINSPEITENIDGTYSMTTIPTTGLAISSESISLVAS